MVTTPVYSSADHAGRARAHDPQMPAATPATGGFVVRDLDTMQKRRAPAGVQLQPSSRFDLLPPLRGAIVAGLALTSLAALLQYPRLAALTGAGVVAGSLKEGSMTLAAAASLGAFVALGSMVQRMPRDDAGYPLALWAMFAHEYAFSRGCIDGFARRLLTTPLQLRPDATLFRPSYNIDKTLAACVVLLSTDVPRSAAPTLPALLREVALPSVGVVGTVLLPALLSGYVRWDPLLHPIIMPYLVHNALLVAVPEETLFRGVLPLALMRSLPQRIATPAFTVPIAALVFGYTHHEGGWTYVALSTLAGVGYGIAAERSQGISGGILAHLLLNTMHLGLFTYPALRRGQSV